MAQRRVAGALVVFILLLSGGRADAAWFQRGDVDSSGGRNILDPLLIIRALFQADQVKLGCLEAADVDDSGVVEITDAIALLEYLFVKSPRPWPETLLPGCWIDETGEFMDCHQSPSCSPRTVIYVIDKSGSAGPVLDATKVAATQGILQLSAEDQFAVLFFDANTYWFPSSTAPAPGSDEMKAAWLDYVKLITPGNSTCPKPALLKALTYAENSSSPEKEILFISDGHTTCNGADAGVYAAETLAAVSARNTGGVKIHAIGVGPDLDDQFLRQLAEQNGGTFAVLK
jgi:hypothetical protein